MLTIVVVTVFLVIGGVLADPANLQLVCYRNRTKCPIGTLTASNGAPVECGEMDVLNSPLLNNVIFLEGMTHLLRERIPERAVHAKGAAAFGYFVVTHDLTRFCKSEFLSKIGKKTPIFVRFSSSGTDKGEAFTKIDSRGMAIKFYTKDGNWDVLCFNTKNYVTEDPNKFVAVVRGIKRHFKTGLRDSKPLWDFIINTPKSAPFVLQFLGDPGIPDGFIHMPGNSIHFYEVYNNCGESFFMKFHFIPDEGIKYIYLNKSIELAGIDPDYAIRQLYNRIASGKYPSWTVYVQVLTMADVKKAGFDVFDVTTITCEKEYPLLPLGKIVLNKNLNNFFAQSEQSVFCPGNLVPGILGAPDKMFEARRFAYRDAQLYRLGANFHNIQVNCPLQRILNYDRDGVPPVLDNGGSRPAHFPNSYNGPLPYEDENRPTLLKVTHSSCPAVAYEQAAKLYSEMSEEERGRLINNIVLSLGQTEDGLLQQRAIRLFYKVDPELGARIVAGFAQVNNSTNTDDEYQCPSLEEILNGRHCQSKCM